MSEEQNQVYDLMRAVLQVGRALRANRPESALSITAVSMLAALKRSGPVATGELAKRERLAPQSMARLLADLTKSELVLREHNPLDGRQSVVRLSVKGLRLLKHEMQARRSWLDTALAAQLSEKERTDLLAATQLLRRVAEYEK